jgi:hypothetical protein
VPYGAKLGGTAGNKPLVPFGDGRFFLFSPFNNPKPVQTELVETAHQSEEDNDELQARKNREEMAELLA